MATTGRVGSSARVEACCPFRRVDFPPMAPGKSALLEGGGELAYESGTDDACDRAELSLPRSALPALPGRRILRTTCRVTCIAGLPGSSTIRLTCISFSCVMMSPANILLLFGCGAATALAIKFFFT